MPREFKPTNQSSLISPPSTGLVSIPDGGSSALPEMVRPPLAHIQTTADLVVPERRAGEEQEFEIAPGVKIVMCWVPPGEFLMGSPEDEFCRLPNEKQHWVTITQGFWLGKYQVTQAQWEAVMGSNPSNVKGSNLPVESISWNDISQSDGFLEIVNRYAGPSGIFSLPTEAQWEYACRAGTLSALNNGMDLTSKTEACPNLDEIAWYHKNSAATIHPVGEKKANAWGLHDMQGNVWEWCADSGDYVGGPLIDPRRPDSGSLRIFRGGSRRDAAFYCRIAVRLNAPPTYKDSFTGFRLSLKSLHDQGDMELTSATSLLLKRDWEEPEIAFNLSALEDHRYTETVELTDKLLSDCTRIARWTDPEIALLEVELERVTSELADLETEQAELEHLVSCFQSEHNEALGARLEEILKLRMLMLEHLIKTDPTMRAVYEQAQEDYNEFQRDQKIQKETDTRMKWKLSEIDQLELKSLFRKGSKLCHPDLVPVKHKAAAAAMFQELRKAYDEGDLKRLHQLINRADGDLFDTSGGNIESEVRKKARLKAKIYGIRDTLERSRYSIHQIKRSFTYQTITENDDWADLFERQAKLLDFEIENLSKYLKEKHNV